MAVQRLLIRRGVLSFIAIVGSVTVSPRVEADENRCDYRNAKQAFHQKDYQQSILCLRKWYESEKIPNILLLIAQSESGLEHWFEAYQALREFDDKVPRPDPKLAKARDRLHAAARAKLLARAETVYLRINFPPVHLAPEPEVTATPLPIAQSPVERTPTYKKWWIWTTVGGIVLTTGVVVGVVLNRSRPQYPLDSSTPL